MGREDEDGYCCLDEIEGREGGGSPYYGRESNMNACRTRTIVFFGLRWILLNGHRPLSERRPDTQARLRMSTSVGMMIGQANETESQSDTAELEAIHLIVQKML